MAEDRSGRHLIEYTIAFRVPEGLVERDGDEAPEEAVRRAAIRVLLDHTDQYWFNFVHAPDDPHEVTAQVEWEYEPEKLHAEVRLRRALETISRMLGQRCLDKKHHEELRVQLHTDKEALELLVKEGWADMHDIDGDVIGYIH